MKIELSESLDFDGSYEIYLMPETSFEVQWLRSKDKQTTDWNFSGSGNIDNDNCEYGFDARTELRFK